MPDAQGNLTIGDVVNMQRGVSAMKESKERSRYRDARDDMVEQHGSVQGVVDNVDPSQLDTYGLAAYNSMSTDYKGAMDNKQSREVQAAKANIMAGIKQFGGDPFAYFSTHAPESEAELQATAHVREMYAKDSGFQKQMFQNRVDLANAKGKEAMDVLGQVEQAFASGDTDTAGRLFEGLSKAVPMRGQYKYDPESKTLRRLHLSREQGVVDTGEAVSIEEALQHAKSFTQTEFASQVATHMRATSQFNREQILNGGSEATGPNGEKYKVYAQIDPNRFEQVDYFLYANGKPAGKGKYTAEELRSHGINIRNMEQEQAQAEIDKTKQQTNTSYLAGESHKATTAATKATMPLKVEKAQVDLANAKATYSKALQAIDKGNLDAGRDALKDLLLPFNKGSELVADEDAERLTLTESGHNALADARAYVEGAKKAQGTEDAAKYDPAIVGQAELALKMHSKLTGQHTGKYGLKDSKEVTAIKEAYARMIQQGKTPHEAKELILKANPQYRGVLTGSQQSAMKPH
jgi:hypothetical protein